MVWGVQHLIEIHAPLVLRHGLDPWVASRRGLKSLAERLQRCGGRRLTYESRGMMRFHKTFFQ